MNAASGQILYEKNPNERRAPASTTKLMVMYLIEKALAAHQASLNQIVPVTPDAYQVATEPDVSDAYLDPREHFTLEDMLKFIAVISANDATVAVADALAGDQQAFVDDMNAEARQLHLTNTHYMNPDGLTQAGHYTSALDLATLARDLVTTYPQVLDYTKLPYVTVRHGNTWPSTNELLGKYPGVDGLKTGYTADAGYCFVGTAEQNGVRLIAVVMADTTNDIHQRFLDTAALFDYGFHQFQQSTAARADVPIAQTVTVPNGSDLNLQVEPAQNLVVDLPPGVKGTLQVVSNPSVNAPVQKGQDVGQLEYVVNGQPVVSVPIVAVQNDPKAGFLKRMWRGFVHWLGHLLHQL